jgi:uncharacterized protein YajQ (UPF0234 family)
MRANSQPYSNYETPGFAPERRRRSIAPPGWRDPAKWPDSGLGPAGMAEFASDSSFLFLLPAYFQAVPSFDIVSEVNSMEIENAVNQARKELANRFDFKGSNAEIALEKNEIKLSAEDEFRVRTLVEMVMGKLAKRQISLKNVEKKDADISPLGHARQVIKIKQGIETPVAKEVTSFIRDTKLKVTTQIQGEAIRVSGKSRDDLQSVIAAVRAKDFPVALQFQNFRD